MKNIKIAVGATVLISALVLNFAIAKNAISFSSKYFKTKSQILAETTGDNSIKVALLLDTSNSMDGLIEQAKSQLWKIVGELARMTKNNETPSLQIALYQYGNDRLSQNSGYIQQINPFTSDMDLISEKLFALSTNGGSEYCGQVIQVSVNDLKWGSRNGDLKMIYIAGNEVFTQGIVPYASAISDANEKGIIVNTIYCGAHEEGINLHWKDGALKGKGEYMSINQNKATVYIETPYDQQIGDLNQKLNKTYLHYGSEGKVRYDNQRTQDSNALQYSSANMADRAVFKSSKIYSNAEWDMVDAFKKDKSVLKKKKSELPEAMQNMSDEEVKTKVVELTKERETIQLEIRQLNEKRQAYISNEKAKSQKGEVSEDLQNSMLNSIRKAANEKGFTID